MIRNKNILIAGFTKRTSYALSKALLSLGNTITITDNTVNDEKKSLLDDLSKLGTVVDMLGNQSPDILNKMNYDMVLPSPGVPLNIPILKAARDKGIEIIGDIELFSRFFPDNFTIGITGTDGKTTTTTLINEIIRSVKKTIVGGNIGIPIFEHFNNLTKDTIIILELSSFQLECVKSFHPQIASILNIAEDHLDRYPSMVEYMEAKKNIFNNLTLDNIAILNQDNSYYEALKKGLKARLLTFSTTDKTASIFYDPRQKIIYQNGKKYMDRSGIRMKGGHNIENAMAAILISQNAGVPDESIRKVLGEFPGVEHRIEFVRELNGVEYYNDSKATTVNALEKAILSFNGPIILLAGGRDKGLDFTKIRELAEKKLKELVLIGEASDKIKKELDFQPYYESKSFEDAVRYSHNKAVKGDIILLSPGCASFDMFKNYEERGKTFKEIVNNL